VLAATNVNKRGYLRATFKVIGSRNIVILENLVIVCCENMRDFLGRIRRTTSESGNFHTTELRVWLRQVPNEALIEAITNQNSTLDMDTMTEWVRVCVKSAWKKETKSETLVLSPLILLNYGNWSANIPTISYRDQIQGASRYLGARRHDVRNILVPIKWRFGRLEYWGLAWIPTTGTAIIKIMCPIGRLGETRM
jgi:hypothetical protein